MEMRLTEISSQRLRFWAGGEEHILAPVVAANISVVPLPKEQVTTAAAAIPGQPLTNLNLGQTGQVVNISPLCRGQERRRLMDLGILPGTAITAEMRSPSGDPTAYLIRGALIALRREQANLINITGPEEAMLSPLTINHYPTGRPAKVARLTTPLICCNWALIWKIGITW